MKLIFIKKKYGSIWWTTGEPPRMCGAFALARLLGASSVVYLSCRLVPDEITLLTFLAKFSRIWPYFLKKKKKKSNLTFFPDTNIHDVLVAWETPWTVKTSLFVAFPALPKTSSPTGRNARVKTSWNMAFPIQPKRHGYFFCVRNLQSIYLQSCLYKEYQRW